MQSRGLDEIHSALSWMIGWDGLNESLNTNDSEPNRFTGNLD